MLGRAGAGAGAPMRAGFGRSDSGGRHGTRRAGLSPGWRRNWRWATAPAAGRPPHATAPRSWRAWRGVTGWRAEPGWKPALCGPWRRSRASASRPPSRAGLPAARIEVVDFSRQPIPRRRTALSGLRVANGPGHRLAAAVARRGLRARPGRFSGLGQGAHPGFGKARGRRRRRSRRAVPSSAPNCARNSIKGRPGCRTCPKSSAGCRGGRFRPARRSRGSGWRRRPTCCAASAYGWRSAAAGRACSWKARRNPPEGGAR